MKRLLCILLCIVLPTVSVASVLTYTLNNYDTVTAQQFVDEIGKLMQNSDSDDIKYGQSELLDEKNDYSEFQSRRLIVKSQYDIDTCGATSVVGGYNDLWILCYETQKQTAEAYEYYNSRSGIEFVEPDRQLYALDSVTAYYSESDEFESWGPAYIGLDKFNDSILSSGIELKETVVAVLDTGTQDSHPAFGGRVIPSGVNTSTSGKPNCSDDDNGHGTQVAGVIIDSTLDNVIVKPYKVLDQWGQGTVITLAAGIICAVDDGVDIINMSIALSENSETLKEAVMLADRNDILLVAASGNDSSDTLFYPASYESVIKVGAINENGTVANFSTRGEDVDFAAPGVNIYTTHLGGGFKTVSGTSFASPLVASLAASMLSYQSDLSTEDIKDILIENSVYVQETDSKIKYGNGIVHAPEFGDPSQNIQKTAAPYFSHRNTVTQEEIDLEIFCDTPDAVVYYTTDRTVPSKSNPSSMIYDGTAIHIPETTVITAVAYCDGMYRSPVSTFASIIVPYIDEQFLEIDASGVITSYTGSKVSFTVPETVRGLTVTGIGESVFEGMDISEIFLPVTVTSIGASAFKDCSSLKTIFAKGVTKVSDYALYNCVRLKNIYFGQITSVGKYSFYSVCSSQYTMSGTTVTLEYESLTSIAEGAFQNAAVSDVDLKNVSSIGKAAFLNCAALVSVQIDNLSNISNEVFKNCTSLSSVEILGLSFVSNDAFSGCKSLTEVNIPDATYINGRAFENCVSLNEICLDSAITVYSTAFNNCTSLRIIKVPEMTAFESAVYRAGTTTFPKFSSALQAFIAPKLTKTSAYMFGSAPNIQAVSFKNLKTVADNTFSGCNNMIYLNIENVTTLSSASLAGCEIDFIDARNLQNAAFLPDNSGIMLSKNFEGSNALPLNLTVYGTAGTVAENFATSNEYSFYPTPFVYEGFVKNINEISGTVSLRAVGFNLTYQWYSNTVNSNEGGTPIEGATSSVYTFTDKDTSFYYYCVVTQDDFGIISDYATDVIIKDPKSANYERYNLAVKDARNLVPEQYTNYNTVLEALSVDVSGKRSCEQRVVDEQAAAIRAAIAKLKYNKVSGVTLKPVDTSLKMLERTKIDVITYPFGSVYKDIEWSSEDNSVFVVSKTGYVRCVGNGSTYIVARITNHDGSVIFGRVKMKSVPTSGLEQFLASFFRVIFIVIAEIRIK